MIRWGIIGCGEVTEVKSGPGFQSADHSRLVAVMRRNAERAADYARRHGVPRWYDSAEALLADPEVDAVSIATPPSSHCELALKAARLGKPTLVEKPMARTHDECLRMSEAFERAGVPLFVAYYRRALPRFLKIKELVDGGAVGQPLVVTVTYGHPMGPVDPGNLPWRFRHEISGGGLFVDLACHTLDFLDFLFGPMTSVHGHAARQGKDYEVEDAVVMSFHHAGGVQGVGRWHFNTHRREDRVEIDGTSGSIRFSTFWNEPVELVTSAGPQRWDIPHPPAIQQPLIQTIVDELEGRGRCPSTGESAARTSWVIEQVLKPYYSNS